MRTANHTSAPGPGDVDETAAGEDVKTAIGAARAEQAREEMT